MYRLNKSHFDYDAIGIVKYILSLKAIFRSEWLYVTNVDCHYRIIMLEQSYPLSTKLDLKRRLNIWVNYFCIMCSIPTGYPQFCMCMHIEQHCFARIATSGESLLTRLGANHQLVAAIHSNSFGW